MNNFVLVLLLAAFPALSTDMYLPAIPTLCTIWNIPLAQANLSLVAFFVSFSSFLLIHGPLSDRYGRRPVLLGGLSLYIAGCLACAASPSITVLVLARILQAFGAAAASAMSLALAKDLYTGDQRKKVLAYLGVIIPLCPMIAPTIGASMLQYLSWRGIFLFQALLALPGLYGSFRLDEPLTQRGSGGVLVALRRYRALFRNTPYLIYTLAFSVVGFPFFAYIAGSSDIYITGFGLSEQSFGLYFAFNAFALMLGSLLAARLCVGIASRTILYVSLTGMLLSALALFGLSDAADIESLSTLVDFAALPSPGSLTPLGFAAPMFGYSLFMGMSRPISNHMILEQVDRDTGTAAALLTFFIFICGAAAMELISLDWPSKPFVIAVMGVLGTVLPFLAMLSLRRVK